LVPMKNVISVWCVIVFLASSDSLAMSAEVSTSAIRQSARIAGEKFVACAFDEIRGRLGGGRSREDDNGNRPAKLDCYLSAIKEPKDLIQRFVESSDKKMDGGCSRALEIVVQDIEKSMSEALTTDRASERLKSMRKIKGQLGGALMEALDFCESRSR